MKVYDIPIPPAPSENYEGKVYDYLLILREYIQFALNDLARGDDDDGI